MKELRPKMNAFMFAVQLAVLFSLISVTTFAATIPIEKTNSEAACDPSTGCVLSPTVCPEGCIGDSYTAIEERRKPAEFIFKRTVISYDSQENDDMALADRSATMREEKVDKVFQGILISAMLFITCATVCVLSVCAYCCHIRHSDRKLKEEVNALAKKLNIDITKRGTVPSARKKQRNEKEESCNVVVSDTDIMCV